MQAHLPYTPAKATIISYGEQTPLERRVASFCDFYGVDCLRVRLGYGKDDRAADSAASRCILVEALALTAMLADPSIGEAGVRRWLDEAAFVLVFGITDSRDMPAVAFVSERLVSAVVKPESRTSSYRVADNRRLTAEFSGRSFGPIDEHRDYALELNREGDPAFATLIAIGRHPFFAVLDKPHSRVFLLACGDVADPEDPVDGKLPARQYFSNVVPMTMFLRHVFNDAIWQNPKRFASLVIDDPLLQESYGFLNYERLLQAMDQAAFTCSIAFIPWNYRRTQPNTARLIRERADRFFVCVHGCDHTDAEFAGSDVNELGCLAALALDRMRTHQRNTGIVYADVMVFPQGKFSVGSLAALKSQNYLAALNSSPIPQDLKNEHGLRLRDLLAPAISKYAGFPLFTRRYPRDVTDSIFDLFLGKPAFLVEHHGYFKDGYEKICDFAAQLNAACPDLVWSGAGEIARNVYPQRRTSAADVEVRALGNRQTITNAAEVNRSYAVHKPEDGAVGIVRVRVDGRPHAYELTDGGMLLRLDVAPKVAVDVAIDYATPPLHESDSDKRSFKQEVKVYVRRHLSEVRDNYLAKHDGLLSLAYKVKNGGRFGL
jgi:hypothetical protein